MRESRRGWLPEREAWLAYLRFLGLFLAAFLPVYIGAGYLNARWPERALQLHAAWERDIPLVPWMVWAYLSLYTVYALPLLHLDPRRLRRLTLQSVAVVLVAGLVFLLLPVRSGYAPLPVDGLHGPMVRLVALVDTPFNLVPSLHVTCAALVLLACGDAAGGLTRRLYLAWLLLLVLSTLLVHQHHLLDAVTGLALALAARRLIPLDAAGGSSR